VSGEKFRAGVVAVLRDARGEFLLCERADRTGSWQFPQGGIEPGETPEQAFHRELFEELGIEGVTALRLGDRLTRYRWPEIGRDGVHGQEQRWILGESPRSPDLSRADGSFRAWRWVTAREALALVIEWKRPAYEAGFASLGIPLA
jgi:putative (di)nucleoside polyphosphate hydrolase